MNENFFSPLSPPVTGEEEVKTMDSSLIPLFPHILHLVHQQLCLHKRIWNPAPSSLILHKYQPAPSISWMVVISLITNLCVFTVAALPPANKQVFLKHKSEHIIFLQGLPTAIRIRFKLLSFPKGSVRSGTLYAHRCSLPFSDHSGYCSLFPHTYSCLRDFSWVLSSTWQDLRLDFPRAASRDQGSGWGLELVNPPLHPGWPLPCSSQLLISHCLKGLLLFLALYEYCLASSTQNICFMRSRFYQSWSCWVLSFLEPRLFLH